MKKIYNVPATSVITFKIESHLLTPSDPNIKMSTNNEDRHDADKFDTRKNNGVGSGLWSDMQ